MNLPLIELSQLRWCCCSDTKQYKTKFWCLQQGEDALNHDQLAKKADSFWRSILSIVSVLSIVLSLVLLSAVISMISSAGGDNFKKLFAQVSLATVLITPLLAAGYYLSKRSKPPVQDDVKTNASIFRKEIDLTPFLEYFFKYTFAFLLSVTVISYILDKHFDKTSAALLTQQQFSELKKSSRSPVVTYYFDVDKYNKITDVVMDSGGSKINISHNDIAEIWSLIYKAEVKPEVIEIHGYADDSGIDAKNIILSRKRSEFVSNLFKDADFPAKLKINIVNGGVAMSSCNQSAENRDKCLANNRRVDVYFNGYVPARENNW